MEVTDGYVHGPGRPESRQVRQGGDEVIDCFSDRRLGAAAGGIAGSSLDGVDVPEREPVGDLRRRESQHDRVLSIRPPDVPAGWISVGDLEGDVHRELIEHIGARVEDPFAPGIEGAAGRVGRERDSARHVSDSA